MLWPPVCVASRENYATVITPTLQKAALPLAVFGRTTLGYGVTQLRSQRYSNKGRRGLSWAADIKLKPSLHRNWCYALASDRGVFASWKSRCIRMQA
jgi:hypothetical protein